MIKHSQLSKNNIRSGRRFKHHKICLPMQNDEQEKNKRNLLEYQYVDQHIEILSHDRNYNYVDAHE